jgi:hypothetical protein
MISSGISEDRAITSAHLVRGTASARNSTPGSAGHRRGDVRVADRNVHNSLNGVYIDDSHLNLTLVARATVAADIQSSTKIQKKQKLFLHWFTRTPALFSDLLVSITSLRLSPTAHPPTRRSAAPSLMLAIAIAAAAAGPAHVSRA